MRLSHNYSLFLCGSTDRAAAAEVIANLVATGDNAQNKAAIGKDRAISLIMHGLLPKDKGNGF
jgi:cation transport ATPase